MSNKFLQPLLRTTYQPTPEHHNTVSYSSGCGCWHSRGYTTLHTFMQSRL